MSAVLPAGFAPLEPFVAVWAVEGTAARAALRGISSEADRQAFYDVAKDHLVAALALLDAKPIDQFDLAEQNLMNLMLALAHVSLAVEVQRDHESELALQARHMPITRSTAGA